MRILLLSIAWALLAAWVGLLSGCSETTTGDVGFDAGAFDASDAGRADLSVDSGAPDLGREDVGPDLGLDAGLDSGVEDVGPVDAGPCGSPAPMNPVSCGQSAIIACDECVGFDECATDNVVDGAPCTHCPPLARVEACEAGRCRTLDGSGRISFSFSVDGPAVGAPSFVYAVLTPITADGTRLDCAALVSTCTLDFGTNVVGAAAGSFNPPAQRGLSYISLATADVGTDRLLLLKATSMSGGRGDALAVTCLEGIEVRANDTVQVSLPTLE